MKVPTTDDAITPLPTSLLGDSSLLQRVRDGDESAAAKLFDRYAARLRALAEKYCRNGFTRRFDADDIVQSVFRVLFTGIRQSGYAVPPDGEIWGLLTVLALNKVRGQVEHHRAAKRDVQRTAGADELGEQPDLDDTGSAALLRLVLEEQLAAVPESNRDIVRLRMEGYELKEIAERVGRSRRTVERVLQEFRNRLTPPE
jgi:RNA polymerase sigma-70 factor (ECF subfamily)